MTSLEPDYGQTPLSPDHLETLTHAAREALGKDLTHAALYDLEQAVQVDVTERTLGKVLAGDLVLGDILRDRFLFELHAQLYGDIWTWAGKVRRLELNVGVPPEHVTVELRTSLDTLAYRWQHTPDWTARELGIAAHAEAVRIHPFTDGNGRATRLLADLTFLAAQSAEALLLYDWSVDKTRYIELLREYDQHRDPRDLAAFVPLVALNE